MFVGRDVRFGFKLGQIGTKWDKCGTFKDQFLVNRRLILNSTRPGPFVANMVKFGSNMTHLNTFLNKPIQNQNGLSQEIFLLSHYIIGIVQMFSPIYNWNSFLIMTYLLVIR